MLKNSSLPTVAALGLCAALAFIQGAPSVAQEPAPEKSNVGEFRLAATDTSGKPASRSRAKSARASQSTEAPVPEVISTPAPKKPNIFQRIFGTRKKKPEATPAPTRTPTPTPRKSSRKSQEPSSKQEPSKPKTTPDKPKTSEEPTPASPTSAKTEIKPKATVAETKKAAVAPVTVTDAERDAKEKARFDQAKEKAAEDPQVKALKVKADNASTDEESRKNLRAYNKALFEKIRRIDSGVADRATRLEAAILKRLNE